MSYIVLARRWRPQNFSDIIGQEHVSKTLSNAIETKRIAHSFIFAGPRGVGKTTTARILAKALNCEKGPTAKPCNECSNCKAITSGNSLDVLEIDGASNRGIDEIRNLRENIRFAASQGKYRIYIIDEVHMLTKEAFNALLKTLEEPPAHVIFIFATTEIHRVPATILSRCQRFDFKRIPTKVIVSHLEHICKIDKIKIDEDALLEIAKKADGSMRDAQSILDQIISYGGENISSEHVRGILGIINLDVYFDLTEKLLEKDIKKMFALSQEIFMEGTDLGEFLTGLEEHIRNLLITKTMQNVEFINVAENYQKKYLEVSEKFSQNDLLQYLQMITDLQDSIKWATHPQIKFELGLLKLIKMPTALEIETLLGKINLLKKKSDLKPSESITVKKKITTQKETVEKKDKKIKFNKKNLVENWVYICDHIKQKKAMLASSIELGIPEIKKENELALLFTSKYTFQVKMVQKNIDLLENTLKKFFTENIKVTFEIIEEKEADKHKNKNMSKEDILKNITKENPVISKLIDELGLEIS